MTQASLMKSSFVVSSDQNDLSVGKAGNKSLRVEGESVRGVKGTQREAGEDTQRKGPGSIWGLFPGLPEPHSLP